MSDNAIATTTQSMGFINGDAFALIQRVAVCFSKSNLVPKDYRGPNGVPNCVIALNIAQRLGADPLMVMQNLYVVHGKPSWSATFIIGGINSCGRFNPLRFELSAPEAPSEVATTITYYEQNQKRTRQVKEKIRNRTCIAWTTEKGMQLPKGVATLQDAKDANVLILEGPEVSIRMAVEEGWFSKDGSKWKTMPDLMLRYRAATFFGRLFAPDVLMGLRTTDEMHDVNGELGTLAVAGARLLDGPQADEEVPPQEPADQAEEVRPAETTGDVQEEAPAVVESPEDALARARLLERVKVALRSKRWPQPRINDLLHRHGAPVIDRLTTAAAENMLRELEGSQDSTQASAGLADDIASAEQEGRSCATHRDH